MAQPTRSVAASRPPVPTASKVASVVVPVVLAALAPTVAPLVGEALDGRSTPVAVVVAGGLWAAWTLALVASLVPRTASLTLLRIVVPAAPAVAGWAALAGSSDTALTVLGVGSAALAAAAVLHPAVGDRWVDGSSYGDERRFCLRPPTVVLVGPLQLLWALTVTAAVAGPLLLAAQVWLAGVPALLAGWPLAWLGTRSMHRLTRRWLVFVPAGIVVHDDLAVADALMVPRVTVEAVGPAPADTSALDLTLGALGLVVQVGFTEPVEVLTEEARRQAGAAAAATSADAVLVAPTRPGLVLDEAERRRLPVA